MLNFYMLLLSGITATIFIYFEEVFTLMERVKYNKVEVCHGDSSKKFPVYEIYLDGVIVTKVSSESDALEMVSRWQEIYK